MAPFTKVAGKGQSWSEEYTAGDVGGYDVQAAMNAMLYQNSPYNYQTANPHSGQLQFQGNYGVGVYASGAGWSSAMIIGAFMEIGIQHRNSPSLQLKQINEALQGLHDANVNCHT